MTQALEVGWAVPVARVMIAVMIAPAAGGGVTAVPGLTGVDSQERLGWTDW